jgi:hypothetical protein
MVTAAEAMAWASFVGSWLLVAGPMLQGALELHAEDIDREALHRVVKAVPISSRVSAWWWLVPPVLYVLHWKNTVRYRKEMFAAMTVEQREKTVSYINKAMGWFIFSGGGTLLACQATWQLVERYRLPPWSFWLVVLVTFIACTLHTAARMIRTDRMVKPKAALAGATASPRPTSL